jgi:hypothetical protein
MKNCAYCGVAVEEFSDMCPDCFDDITGISRFAHRAESYKAFLFLIHVIKFNYQNHFNHWLFKRFFPKEI